MTEQERQIRLAHIKETFQDGEHIDDVDARVLQGYIYFLLSLIEQPTLLEKLLLGNDKLAFRLYGTDTASRETIQVYALNDKGMYAVSRLDDLHGGQRDLKYFDFPELTQHLEKQLEEQA